MAAALQPAAGVDGLLSTKPGVAGFSVWAALSVRAKPHCLGLMELAISRGIMKLCQIDVIGTHACELIGLFCQSLADVLAIQIPVCAGAQNGCPDFYRRAGPDLRES